MDNQQIVQHEYEDRFGNSPTYLVRAPGRVNLIGEHTDYNDGFVLPMAINRAAMIAFTPRNDSIVVVESIDMKDVLVFDLNDFTKGSSGWGEYVKGVAWALQEDGVQIQGWDGVVVGDVPIGAGLSSSAALEMAIARTFVLASGCEWDKVSAARVGQKAENQWLGVNSGIMDQMICVAAEPDQALLIDCRSLKTRSVPMPQETRVVILDTNTRRGLVDSAYNERREQCDAAAQHFGVKALRDINLSMLEAEKENLKDELYRRARHVVSENKRVLEAVEILQQGDAEEFGKLMNASHISMRDDFEISRNEMDIMVEISQDQEGCFGARMTGGGFGGCAVAMVKRERVEKFIDDVSAIYEERTGLQAKIFASDASKGTSFAILNENLENESAQRNNN